jgi:hypothetical protein
VIWIANLGEAPQTVAIDGLSGAMRCSVLEVGDVRTAAHDATFLDRPMRTIARSDTLTLGAYAIGRLVA